MPQWSRATALVAAITLFAACGETTDPDPTNPDQVSQQIGAAGGTIVSKDSNLTLEIPPGALAGNVTITVAPMALDELGPEWAGFGAHRAYELGPAGTTFAVPVQVTARSDQGAAGTSDTPLAAELLQVSSNGSLERLDSVRVEWSEDRPVVRAALYHFSVLGQNRNHGVAASWEGDVPPSAYLGEQFSVVASLAIDQEGLAFVRSSVGRSNAATSTTVTSQPAVHLLTAEPATYVEEIAGPAYIERSHTMACAAVGEAQLTMAFYLRTSFEDDPPFTLLLASPTHRLQCLQPPSFTVHLTGPGGAVTIATVGDAPSVCTFDAPGGCTVPALPGELVTLTAGPTDGYAFGSYGGVCAEGEVDDDGDVLVWMPGDGSDVVCDAVFDPLVTATVTVRGPGGTTAGVDVAPIGATCTKSPAEVLATCLYRVAQGAALTLTATAGPSTEFVHWLSNGVPATTSAVLAVAMTEPKLLEAVFQAIDASPLQFLARLVLGFPGDALALGRPDNAGVASAGNGGASAAMADLTSVFVADAGTGGDVRELNLSDPANIIEAGSGGLCEGTTAVVHADDPNIPEGRVFGFSATAQWSCVTGYPLGQAIGLFNMGSPTGKAMLVPGNASHILVAHWGAGALWRLTPSPATDAFTALVPGVRSCPRFLKATATEAYLVTVEGTVGTPSEPCNTNRGLHRVRLSDNTVTGFVPFGTKPRDPVISADGSTIYVPDYAENQIYVVDAGSMTVSRTIAVPGGPVAAVLTADGTHLIVARWDVGDIALINATTGQGVGAIASGGVHPTALLLGENNVVVVLNFGDPDTDTTGAIATFRYTIP